MGDENQHRQECLCHGVLCCGNAVVDILVRPVVEPGWGKTTWVDTIEQQLGGNGANTS